MTEKEFIERLEKFGFSISYFFDNISIYDKEGERVALVSTSNRKTIDTWSYNFDKLSELEQDILFDLIVDYARS